MKKATGILALLLCMVMLFSGCATGNAGTDQEQTPEAVVKQYFAYWANRDKASMDRLLVEGSSNEEDDPDVELVTSLTLNSCMAVSDELREEWDPEMYADPYDFAYVDVDFDITFEGGESAGYTDGNYQSRFYLVQEEKGSEWKIVTWGLG